MYLTRNPGRTGAHAYGHQRAAAVEHGLYPLYAVHVVLEAELRSQGDGVAYPDDPVQRVHDERAAVRNIGIGFELRLKDYAYTPMKTCTCPSSKLLLISKCG
jgi:hypothetical protein